MPTKKAPAAPQVMDITHPGKVKPTASSVPIIVTNRPILKDPMVVEADAKTADTTDTATKAPTFKKLEIKPLTAEELKPTASLDAANKLTDGPILPISADNSDKPTEKAEATEAKESPAPAETPKADTPAFEPPKPDASEVKAPVEVPAEAEKTDTTTPPEESVTAATETEPEADATAGDDLLGGGDKPADTKAAKEAREAAEKQLALEKLISEGTYVLPVNTVEKRRVHELILVVILIVLVLGIAAFVLALDAGYVHIAGFNPPTNFIKN